MPILLRILTGVVVAPIGAVAVCAAVYVALRIAGETEHQGRRGLLAGVFGIVPGLVLGFCAGYWAGSLPRNASVLAFTADLAIALAGAGIAFSAGLIIGTARAEARGISNYAGERAAWGLFHVALPLAAVVGAAVFILLQCLRP